MKKFLLRLVYVVGLVKFILLCKMILRLLLRRLTADLSNEPTNKLNYFFFLVALASLLLLKSAPKYLLLDFPIYIILYY